MTDEEMFEDICDLAEYIRDHANEYYDEDICTEIVTEITDQIVREFGLPVSLSQVIDWIDNL